MRITIDKILTRLIFSFFIFIAVLERREEKELIPCNERTHVAFFKKDKWICGICGKVVEF